MITATVNIVALGDDDKGKRRIATEKTPTVIRIDTATGKSWELIIRTTDNKPEAFWAEISD